MGAMMKCAGLAVWILAVLGGQICKGQKEELQCGIDCFFAGGYQPVCGSNGKTYTNEACLKQHACETGTDITVASQGKCPKERRQRQTLTGREGPLASKH